MSSSSSQSIVAESRTGSLNYLDGTVQHSLYRNGKVLIRRDSDGNDEDGTGVSVERREVNIRNARALSTDDRRTLTSNGFELLDWPYPSSALDFFDHQQVVREYYAQCVAFVEAATGARAFAFDHNVRSATGKKSKRMIPGGQQVQGPAHVVHGDYTLSSAPQRLRDLAKEPSGNDTLRAVLEPGQTLIDPERVTHCLEGGGRFAIINVWRNIAPEPVVTRPLALCDAMSVRPEDLVVFEIHYQDRIGENYFAKHSPHHDWFGYPEITGDEALLIKQWDSAGKLAQSDGAVGDGDGNGSDGMPCTFSFHTAYRDPSTPEDAPDRLSIEVRCVVFYD